MFRVKPDNMNLVDRMVYKLLSENVNQETRRTTILKRQIANELGVSELTVHRSSVRLETEALIIKHPQRGINGWDIEILERGADGCAS